MTRFCSSLYSLLLFSDSLWARWLTTTWNRLRETWKVWDVPVGLCVRNLNGMVANVFVFIAMSLPVVIMIQMYTTTIMANKLSLVKTVQLLRFLGSTVLGPRHTIPLASTTGSTASTNLTYGRLPCLATLPEFNPGKSGCLLVIRIIPLIPSSSKLSFAILGVAAYMLCSCRKRF